MPITIFEYFTLSLVPCATSGSLQRSIYDAMHSGGVVPDATICVTPSRLLHIRSKAEKGHLGGPKLLNIVTTDSTAL